MPIHLSDDPMTWIFTGDSITQAVFQTHGARSWVEHCHERIRWELDRLDDVVINTGMSGWTAPMVLERVDHLVTRFSPDVVSISLGTNDASVEQPGDVHSFEASMRELVAVARRDGAQVALHTPAGISDSAMERYPNRDAYSEAVRAIARELDLVCVDHAAHWPGAHAARFRGATEPIGWLNDAIHPNAAGHRVMADLTLETFGLGALHD